MQLIVLGMHRSGTSCVSGLLKMMGAYFGPDDYSIGASRENPKGFWERRDVRGACDSALHGAGADWDRVAHFSVDRIPPSVRQEVEARFRQILADIDGHRPWFIKEPRLCLLFPILRPMLDHPVCVHVHRDPLEVADSLRTRNGFPLDVGIALWERYNLAALGASSRLPRLFVRHRQLMSDPVAAVERLHAKLSDCGVTGLRLPNREEAAAYVDRDLYRERSTTERHKAFLSQAQLDLLSVLDHEGVSDSDTLPPLSEGAQESLLEFERRQEQAENKMMLERKLGERDAKTKDLQKQIGSFQEEARQRDLQITNLQRQVRQQNLQIANLQQQVRQQNLQISEIENDLAGAEQDLQTILMSRRYKLGSMLAVVFNSLIPRALRRPVLNVSRVIYRSAGRPRSMSPTTEQPSPPKRTRSDASRLSK